MLQQSPMVPSLNLAYATLTPFSWSLIAFWHKIARSWRPCRTLIELPRPPPETSTNIAKFDPLFFSKKTGGQNPSKEHVLWTNGFGVAARGARKFYEIFQAVYKMTFWPSLHRHKQNYGCQMHFINQTPLQFPSIPNIFKNDHKWSQIPEIFSRKGHHWFFGKHPWLVSILFHSIEKIWPHNFDIKPFLLKSHLVLAHLCQIPASEQISFKLFIKWLSDHLCIDANRITDAKCIL